MSELLLRRRNLLIRKQEEEMNIRAVCFKADGEQTVTIKQVNTTTTKVFQYSYDGVTWESWDLTPLPFGGPTKVYVRGYNHTLSYSNSKYVYFSFSTDAYVYVSGIVESLLDGDNEVLTYGNKGILRQIFYNQTALRSVENLRFEAQSTAGNTTVYALMFYGCSNLLYAPKALSIEILSGYDCIYMFQGCTSLLTAPTLPATTLSKYCYQYMFQGCTSLLTAPKIMAMTTAYGSQKGMFQNCTSLVNAPELPATNLDVGCYTEMFDGCTSLVNAPTLPATTLSQYCYKYMFQNCTSLVNAPTLPATTLSQQCYYCMFQGCTSLKSLKCHAKAIASEATYNWLNGVKTSGTFYGHSEYGWSSGTSGIPTNWTFEELTD